MSASPETTRSIGITPEGRFVEFVIVPMDTPSSFLKGDELEDAALPPIQVAQPLAMTQAVVRDWATRSFHLAISELILKLQRLWKCKRLPLHKDKLTGALAEYIRRSFQLLVQYGNNASQDVMCGMATILQDDVIPALDQHAREIKELQRKARQDAKTQLSRRVAY